MSSIYNHLRQGRDKSIDELKFFIRAEVELQERLETMGYRSPTWRLLRALQSLLSAVQLQGESAVTAPPFFPSAGRGTTQFWGKRQGPAVFLWESLDEAGRKECEETIRTRRDWVVWSSKSRISCMTSIIYLQCRLSTSRIRRRDAQMFLFTFLRRLTQMLKRKSQHHLIGDRHARKGLLFL